MKFRLTIVAMALSVLAVGPVYAGGAGGCDYSGRYQSTSVEPQEESEAAKKLASLGVPVSDQEISSAPAKADAGASPNAETTTTQ